jgi:hypothetical protein
MLWYPNLSRKKLGADILHYSTSMWRNAFCATLPFSFTPIHPEFIVLSVRKQVLRESPLPDPTFEPAESPVNSLVPCIEISYKVYSGGIREPLP